MENNEMPFFSSEEYLKQEQEELLKNPPQPIKITYSLEELKDAVDKYVPVVDNTPAPNYIEDYYEFANEEYKYGNKDELLKAIYEYYGLEDKNDLQKISEINNRIIANNGDDIKLPNEIYTTISELSNLEKYLKDMKKIDDYNREQSLKTEQDNIRVQEEQQQLEEQQVQQARYNEIQSKLPIINEQLDRIRELPKNTDIYETRKNELLRERLYFYHKVNRSANDMISGIRNEITAEDIDKLNEYMATLDSIEQEIINSNKQVQQQEQVQETEFIIPEPVQQANMQEQEEINRLKQQISNYDMQIGTLLASMQPYMQVPKVNQEISKVIAKNEQINSSQIIDSLSDYRNVVEIKQSLVVYLEQANKFIKDNVENRQQAPQVVEQQVQEQTEQQPLPDNFWDEFDQPQQEQKPQQPIPNDLWDEFDNPQRLTRPERIYNEDGTYTMEYIAYQANTPIGFNQDIYDQLLQHNDRIRSNKNNSGLTSQQADQMIQAMINGQLDTNGQPIVQNQEEMTNGRQMGFAKVWILGILVTLMTIGIGIILGDVIKIK